LRPDLLGLGNASRVTNVYTDYPGQGFFTHFGITKKAVRLRTALNN